VGKNYWGLLLYRILELKCRPNLDSIINNLEYLDLAVNNVNSHTRINSNNNNIAYNLDVELGNLSLGSLLDLREVTFGTSRTKNWNNGDEINPNYGYFYV